MELPIGITAFLASVIGLFTGGIFVWIFKTIAHRRISMIYSVSAGMILSLVFLDILPESVEVGGLSPSLIGLTLGILFFVYLHSKTSYLTIITNDSQKDLLLYTGIVLTLSISLHNIPTGIIIGASHHMEVGDSLLSALILHTIPEGIALLSPLLLAGYGLTTLIAISFFVSIPIGLSAMIGESIGLGSPSLLSLLISFAMGIILVVTIKEILIEAFRKSNAILCSGYFIMGFFSIYLFHLYTGH
jgi:ZIP family zinc transporter